MEKICETCQNTFDAKRSTARYCGDTCRKTGLRKKDKPAAAPVKPVKPIENHVIIRKPADIDKAIEALPHGLKGGGLSKDQLAIRLKKLGY